MAQKTITAPRNTSKKLLVKGKSNLIISQSLIIQESKARKVKSDAKIYETLGSRKAAKNDLCTHCGIRKKGPGFRFLCRYCFRKAGDEPVYSINFNRIGEDIFFPKISG